MSSVLILITNWPFYDLHENSRPGRMRRWPSPVGPAGLMKALPPFDVMTRTDEESSSSLDLMHLPPIVCVCACVCSRVRVCDCVVVQRGHLFLESNLESCAQPQREI